jgi:predicted 3-demethylubiquinone-9 3-methyltransferase (glyoxalase superfamily)
MAKVTQRIGVCLWFDDDAEEAVKFYTSIFKNARTGDVLRYDEESAKASGRPVGSVLTVEFELDGQQFLALNGGPEFKFTEAVSFAVGCEDQAEIDYYWEKLTAGGGKPVACGWLKDRYGLCWQIVPKAWDAYYKDPERAARVMQAMMKMVKLDIAALEAAAR